MMGVLRRAMGIGIDPPLYLTDRHDRSTKRLSCAPSLVRADLNAGLRLQRDLDLELRTEDFPLLRVISSRSQCRILP